MKDSDKAKKTKDTTEYEKTNGGNKVYTGPRGGKYIYIYCNKNKKKKYVK